LSPHKEEEEEEGNVSENNERGAGKMIFHKIALSAASVSLRSNMN